MSERFAWIFDKQKQKKIWCADMWARKAVLAVQTAITGIVSRLTTVENAGYQTASDVSAAIATAIGGITELEYLVVSTLPASGTKGVIYLVPHQHGTRDIYDEYIWVNNTFEKIGSTDVDLSQYLLKTDISAWAKASTKPTYTASEVGALPDTTSIPSKTSDLTNDSGYITGYTETDPTVPAWAKASTKPIYTAAEVGALPDDTVIPTVPTKVSAFQNDAGYLTSYTETDPTVPSWAKQSTKPSYTAAEVGALPDSTPIPAKTSDLTNDSNFQTEADVDNAISAEAGRMVPYGYCTIAAGTVAKTVTVSPAVTALTAGLCIAVKFQYANTATNPTLNVNGLGAKAIKRYETTAAGITPGNSWNANSVVMLVYDGTSWLLCDWNNTIYYGIADDEYIEGTSTVNKLITAARLKAAILYHAPVQSVNGQIGAVALDAADVGAQDALTAAQLAAVNSGITSEYVSSKLAVITCTLASSNTYGAFTALPTGFTKDNCVMLVIQVPDGSGERIGQGIFTTTNMRLFAEMTTSGVRIYNNTSRYYGATVKVVLMRTDI